MMHQKVLLFGDTATGLEIMKVSSPRKQKLLGREVERFVESIWMDACSQIVERGNYLKFTQGTNAASMRYVPDIEQWLRRRDIIGVVHFTTRLIPLLTVF